MWPVFSCLQSYNCVTLQTKKNMNNIIKSRWFKFVLRTLADWVALVLLFLLAGLVRTIVDPTRCNYNRSEWNAKLDIIENFDIIVDTINGRSYYIAVDTVHNYKFNTGIRPYYYE